VQDATGANLNVGAAQAEYVYAWSGNDTLNAATAATGVTLIGEAGADSLTGSAFNDYVYFDALDTINAGAGRDALFYYQGTGQALANLNLNVAAANAEYVLTGAGNDTLFNTGSSTAVSLLGGAGNDTLTGGLGNDYFYGDSGTGNLGADVFVVTNNAQSDVILDFANGADRLNVHNTGFTTFAQIQAAATDNGYGAVINFGGGNSVTLYNFALGNLDASDIIF
jgi:Ca2+-binding RTX toxin-like protein